MGNNWWAKPHSSIYLKNISKDLDFWCNFFLLNDQVIAKRKMSDEKLEKAITEIRRSLQAEGGDMELIGLTDDGVAKIGILGKSTCGICPKSAKSLPVNVAKILKKKVPKIKKVKMSRKCP